MSAAIRLTEDPDLALEDFLTWVGSQGVDLYPHQESAILEIFAGNHVVLDAPTGSGKSLVAQALVWRAFAAGQRAIYTAPIKALVSEKFFQLCQIFGPHNVAMVTGDGVINRDAPIIACTAEILANLSLREGHAAGVRAVVMDEFHYYGDRDRGRAWQIPLLTLPDTQFLLLSGTLGDTSFLREDLEQRSQRKVAEVRGAHRPVPLHFSYSTKPIHEALADLVRTDKAPIYVVHFTQNAAADQAQALLSTDFCTKEEKRRIGDALAGFRFASPFGPTLKRMVSHGVGLHHAGLLPRYRLLVERLAQAGLLKIICGTDTLGVGINVPIRTVVLTQLCKWDGERTEILKVRDFQQISGRAGRAGFDVAGWVVVQAPEHVIENLRQEAKAGDDEKKRRRIVKAQPPTKGYKHWDEQTFRRLVDSPPERLESRFDVDHGVLLLLMQAAEDRGDSAQTGVRALHDLVDRSHSSDKEKAQLHEKTDALVGSLLLAGVVEEVGDRLQLAPGLQRDFSLHHSLSVVLLDALDGLDPWAEDHRMRLLGWVESILEQPRAILLRQQDQARGERLAELKAAGVPYEERQELLEEVSWPKPYAEAIYDFWNAYLPLHPWLDQETIHPKGITAAMAETFCSFPEFVRDLGLERIEGVLLRYLSDTWRTLQQNVPERHHTEAVLDLIAWLRATLSSVDSSLVTEWEAMVAGRDAKKGPDQRPCDIAADRRTFHARIRAEVHAIVRALALGQWEILPTLVRDDAWGPGDWERTIQPFVAEAGPVAFDHQARLTSQTEIESLGPRQWEVRHRILPRPGPLQEDDEEDGDSVVWLLVTRVDLRGEPPEGPLLELVRLGP